MSRIAEYIDGYNYEEFKKDYKTVDAVIRNFEIIGEAAKNIPSSISSKYTNVPWKEMYYLKNRCRTNILVLIMKLFGMLR